MRHFVTIILSIGVLTATALSLRGQQSFPASPESRPLLPAPVSEQVSDTPSPRNANYDIEVALDHSTRTLTARQLIRWRNISTQPTPELQFHLYWNAWRNADSTWLRERQLSPAYTAPREDAWGWVDVSRIRVRESEGEWQDLTTRMRFTAPDDGNERDQTVAVVALSAPVGSGESLEIEVEWTAKVPRPFARTGYIGDYYFVGQWFPKLGVLEDGGWNTHQFHAATEFFSDFGVYDVRITAPSAFVVGASGKGTERTDNPDGTTTHRFVAEDVHDFAWTASPDFIDLTRRFDSPGLPSVDMRLLLQPERRTQVDRYFAIVEATLQRYGEWFGAYPYDALTIVDPAFQSRSDGMEYPTLFTGRSRWLVPEDVQVPEMTTAHEVGHQWWYGTVATNEVEHAWMDEGLTTFATARALAESFNPNHVELRFFGGFLPWSLGDVPVDRLDNDRLPSYRLSAEADAPWTPTYQYWPSTANAISYDKTALWLHTLERLVGWPTLQRILRTYFDRWKFGHPTPTDFFDVVRDVTGQTYYWFFDEVYRSSNTFDYGVQQFRSQAQDDGMYRTSVVVARLGEAVFPVSVVTAFEDGERIVETWDGRDRRARYVYERTARATSVHVDPERVLLLDIDYTNNSRTQRPRSAEASLKWSLRWLVWLQDLMLTYAFFV